MRVPGRLQVIGARAPVVEMAICAIALCAAPKDRKKSFDIAGLQLGVTTQSELAHVWRTDPRTEAGIHPHSARIWRFRMARIQTDGRRYKGHSVIIDEIRFASWSGELGRLLTGSAYSNWLRGLHVGDVIPGAGPVGGHEPGPLNEDVLTYHLSPKIAVCLNLVKGRLVSAVVYYGRR